MKHFILADNQELTRLAFSALIGEQTGADIQEASDKASIVETLKRDDESIVILDYTLLDFADVDNFLVVVERFPKAHWLVVSDDLTVDAMRKMVYGYRNISIVFKDYKLKVFRNAIRYAERNERYLCQRATEALITQQQTEESQTGVLTQTEREVLKAVAQGKSTKEIAQERDSSIHTVNTHKKNIFRKLHVNTAHEAMKYALRAGLVDASEFYI